MSYTVKQKEEVKTIKFASSDGKENNPRWHGMGWYTDVNGVKWDVNGVFSDKNKLRVWARPIDNLPIYKTDSESFGMGYCATWLTYKVEIV